MKQRTALRMAPVTIRLMQYMLMTKQRDCGQNPRLFIKEEKGFCKVHKGREAEAIEIMKKYSPRKCIIHWFTGTERQMIDLLDLGCYFSINSNMAAGRSNSKYLSPQEPTKTCSKTMLRLLQEYSDYINDGVLTKDLEFDSPSGVANFVAKRSTNDNIAWINKEGVAVGAFRILDKSVL